MNGRVELGAPLVPQEKAEVIVRRFGVAGERFLGELPERLAEVARRWRLTLGERLPIGIGGFLICARTEDGIDAVLKLSPTGGGQDRVNELETWALDRWQGKGAVRLFRADPAAGALLIERCVPGATIDSLPDDQMLMAGCMVARRLHRPAEAEDERLLPNAVTAVRERVAVLEEWMKGMGHPLSRGAERIVAKVHAELALDDGAPVVCHGDLNPGNLLSAHREPWLAVDPLPLVAPAAYDAVSLVWSKRARLLEQPDPAGALNLRVELASDALDAPSGRVWAWTIARATAILIDRFAWGGYNETPFISVVELLCQRPPARA